MPRKYLIAMIVIFLVIGTLGIASLLPGPIIEVTPSEEVVGIAGALSGKAKDANLITGAAVGAPSVDRSVYLNFTEEVRVEDGELTPLKIIAKNTGQYEIQPRLDIKLIKQPKTKDVICSDSFSENPLAPGDELITDIAFNCEFEELGNYELSVILIDQDLNILRTAIAEFTIQEVCKLTS